MSRMAFINLPVKDLAKTRRFFTALGFSFDERFSSEATLCLVIGEQVYAMLHVEPTFRSFTGQPITDTAKSREVLVGLSAQSRVEVDRLVDRALAEGGQAVGDAEDQGYMYMRAFRDLDGHQWSFIHMDMSAVSAAR